MKNGFTLLLFLGALLVSGTASAQRMDTIWVNAAYTGSAQTGTLAQPFKTIRGALDKRAAFRQYPMVKNEYIIVKAGNYFPKGTDLIRIDSTNSGRNGKWLTIQSEVPFAATIRGDSLYKTMFAAMVAFADSAQYVKLFHFTLEHLRCNPDSTKWKAPNDPAGSYTATKPSVISLDEHGNPNRTPYGDTIYIARKDVKFGIQIVSDCRNITILDNDISDISWTNSVNPYKADTALTEAEKKVLRNAWPNDNCGPLNVLGTDKDAMKNIILDGNEVHHNIPGWTEAITVNGYIDTFSVINNLVHHNNNIGIVAAGNYPWVVDPGNGFNTPAFQNYARNGVISDNIVHDNLSPIAASAGIYLDGSRNVLVERNQVYNNHVGISVGNEIGESHSGGHTVRNNIVYDNVWCGMVVGSNAPSGAWVENIRVLNNTFFKNNTRAATLLPQKDWANLVIITNGVAQAYDFGNSGEIVTQKLSNSSSALGTKIVVQNNIIRSRLGVPVTVLKPFLTNGYAGAALVKSNLKTLLDWNYNLYYTEPGQNINYDFAAAGFTGNTYNFANYKTETGLDSASAAVELWTPPATDPVFVGGTAFPGRYALVAGSPGINMGNPSSGNSGSNDFIYNSRISGGRIDAGALEFVATQQLMVGSFKSAQVEEKSAAGMFPNPASDETTLRFTESQRSTAIIEISDIHGRLLVRKTAAAQTGLNNLRIANLKAAGFTNGIYFVNMKSGSGLRTFKLFIQ